MRPCSAVGDRTGAEKDTEVRLLAKVLYLSKTFESMVN